MLGGVHCLMPRFMSIKYLIIMLLTLLASSSAAMAEGNGCSSDGITEKVVNCIEVPLTAATDMMLAAANAYMLPVINAIILLSVVVYGIKMATGAVRSTVGETVVLGIKVAAVVYFTQNLASWYPDILEALDDMVTTVTKPMFKSILVCPGVDETNIWARFDCMFISLLGIGVGTVAFVGALAQDADFVKEFGGMGTMALTAGMGIIIGLLISFGRVMMGYIAAKIAIAFLICLAPLFVPLILFQPTRQYFDNWVKQILTYCIQPFILFAFMALALTAIDKAIFTGKYSLAAVMFPEGPVTSYAEWQERIKHMTEHSVEVENQLAQIHMIPEKMKQMQTEIFAPATTEQTQNDLPRYVGEQLDQLMNSPGMANVMNTAEGVATIGLLTTKTFSPEKPELFIQLLVVLTICYLLYLLSDIISDIARDMSGSSPGVAAVGRGFDLPGQKVISDFAASPFS